MIVLNYFIWLDWDNNKRSEMRFKASLVIEEMDAKKCEVLWDTSGSSIDYPRDQIEESFYPAIPMDAGIQQTGSSFECIIQRSSW